jgi:hypothetical protein
MDLLRKWFKTYDQDLDRVQRFWQGEERALVSVYSTAHEYRQCFDDGTILAQAPLHLQAQARLPGMNLPSLFCDWGTVSTAKYWGGKVQFDSTGGNIFINPIAQTIDEALARAPFAVDDPSMDAAHSLSLFQQLSHELQTDALWLRTPDMQGTLNTAGLVMDQEEMMVAMFTDKAKVHVFLDKVCDLLIRYARYLRQGTGNRVCGNIWPYTFFPGELGISLTEDLMPLMSADLYREFGIPYLWRLGSELGGLHIHCCGDWGRHAENLAAADLNIKAVEFHYPFTQVQELACLADRAVFVPYIMLDQQAEFASVTEYYRHLLASTDKCHRFWFACVDDSLDSIAFARGVADTWAGD